MTDNNAPGFLHSLANLGAAGVHEGQQAVDHAVAAARSRKSLMRGDGRVLKPDTVQAPRANAIGERRIGTLRREMPRPPPDHRTAPPRRSGRGCRRASHRVHHPMAGARPDRPGRAAPTHVSNSSSSIGPPALWASCDSSTSPGASSAGAAAHHPCGVINGAAASSARPRSSASRQARARIAVARTAALTLRGRRRSAAQRRAFLLDHPTTERSRT